MPGKLIVLEGTDGSGKTTQLALLAQRLTAAGCTYRKLEFPCYSEPSSALVRLYLEGAMGSSPGDVNAYAASSFFACDRYISYKMHWERDYAAGGLFIAGRYTTSNAVHQASKLPHVQRRAFASWLFDYEYRLLGLPEPDMVLFFDMPPAQALTNVRARAADTGAGDIHEADARYLEESYNCAQDMAQAFGWRRVSCVENGRVRTVEDIHREVWSLAAPLLSDENRTPV